MTPFEQTFPRFVQSCADLNAALLPWAMILLVIAFAVEFWHGPPSPIRLIQFLVLLFLVVLLLAQSHALVTDGQMFVQQWIEQCIPARPENVAARYKELLASAQNAPAGQDQSSFWDTLFSANWFEAIMYAVLTLISWLAMAVLFLVYNLQRAILLLCWAISPLLFPCLAIRPVSSLGLRHLLRIIGIILWPIGLALAATFTDGLLDAAAAQDFIGGGSVLGSLGYGLKTLLAVGVVAIWILVSSALAPLYIQKLIVGSAGPAQVLTHAAQLVSNTGLPSYFGLPVAAHSARQAVSATLHGAGQVWQRMHTSTTPAPNTHSVIGEQNLAAFRSATAGPSSAPWRPNPGDPSGDQQAREIAEAARKK